MKHTLKIAAAAILALTLSGCTKDLDTPPINPNVTQGFEQDGVFTKIYATLGLTGIGNEDGGSGAGDVDGIDEGTSAFYRMQWELNEFPTDEIWWVWGDAGIPEIRAMSWNSSNDLVKGLYARLYFDIALCNYFLDETADKGDDNTKRQRAEVRFIRALNYYVLMDMFGEGVPFADKLVDELPVQQSDLPKPIARKDLFTWLETELKEIEPQMFPDGAKTAYYRADQVAAWLLLSRMYLNAEVYTGTAKWNEAALYAGKVMKSSYTLAPVYRHIFMGDNDNLTSPEVNQGYKEVILPIAQDGMHTRSWGGSLFLTAASTVNGMNSPGTTEQWECMRTKSTLVQKFIPDLNVAKTIKADEIAMPALAGDDRCLLVSEAKLDGTNVSYTATLDGGAENGSESFKKGWGLAKWTNIYASGNPSSSSRFTDLDIPYLRASEAYLTYAEAVERGGTPTEGTALAAVNALRSRANTTKVWTDADLTLESLLDEWSREFYAEGRRRIDLVRHNKFAGSVGYTWEGKGGTALGQDVDAKYNIYPIPQTDLTANQNLRPSPGF